ncbi:MAG: hypothetical protein PVF58_08415 [Candidatus Methanofastidiosia archaeon]
MKNSNRLETYYNLFNLTVEDPRIMPNKMASQLDYWGCGRSPSTLLYHLEQMYEKEISLKPQITLKSFKSYQKTVYFCKKNSSSGLYSLCKKIEKDPQIPYMLCFSSSEFFLISKKNDLNVEDFGLSLMEKSNLFTPQYTIPSNWNITVARSLDEFLKGSFSGGKVQRIVFDNLNWDDCDWRIFHFMKGNIREKFTVVARNTGVSSKTAKKHFFENILPNCVIINYFFPKGFSNYKPAFIKLHSEYEKGIIDNLKKLSCTTYVFPLEKSLVLILFYDVLDTIVDLVKILEKMEEMALIENQLLYCPILYTK